MNLDALFPEITIFVFAVIALFAAIIGKRRSRLVAPLVSVLGVIVSIALLIFVVPFDRQALYGWLSADAFSYFFRILFMNIGILMIFLSADFINEDDRHHGEYYFLLLMILLGAMLISSANDLIMIYISIELISFPAYILAGFRKKDVRSNEASVKYFILGALASGLLLYGMSLIYGLTGDTNLLEISRALPGGLDPIFLISVVMIIAGIGFKIAAVPFHFWSPDTYEGAPITITTLLATMSKLAGFVALYRILIFAFGDFVGIWAKIIAVLAVLSMVFGNLIALPQNNIKRLLAYSGIAHVGYMLIAFTSTSADARWSLIVYFLVYIFMNIGAFSVAMIVEKTKESSELSSFAGLGYSNPYLGVAMTIFMMSLVGLPPFAGFIGKLYIFKFAVESGQLYLAIIGVITSVISLYFYLKVVRQMYFEKGDGKKVEVPVLTLVVITICVIYTLLIALYPEFFTRIAISATS